MKTACFLVFLFCFTSIYGQQSSSPYLEVLTKNSIIPLTKTKADIQITGTIAEVHIRQEYLNMGDTPIEALYVFPLSSQAAVHKMDMNIGDRTIHAKVYERQKADRVYQNALKEGKRAAKLTQHRPNVFQMNVGNIMPKEKVSIDLYYTEMLTPTSGEYQFVFPGAVGPRYTGENNSGEQTFHLPYTKKGIEDSFRYELNLCIDAGMMIRKLYSNTHKINVRYPNMNEAEIFLSKSNVNPSNRDFILKYALRGNKINSGLLLYQGAEENFFAYIMEPPLKTSLEQIPPREYLFILDISGSMTGYPLDVSKKLMNNLLGDLRKTDSFNILLFAGGSTVFKPTPVYATQENLQNAIQFLSEPFGGGSTQLLNALTRAYSLPRMNDGSSRSMIVITDGYVSVEKEAFQMIRNNLNQSNVFTFGIGSSVNRHLIEGMAKVANSQSFIATNEKEAYVMAERFKEYIATPVLTQLKFSTEGFDAYDIEPSSIPDIFSSRPILVFGKWKGKPNGKIVINGKQGNGQFSREFKVSKGSLSKSFSSLKYLWARKKIELLDDYSISTSRTKQEIIELGLRYNLLSKYTSFVAMDHEIVNKKGNLKLVKQANPLPANLNNTAFGASGSIKGRSNTSKIYTVELSSPEELTKNQKRSLIIWIRSAYSELIKKYLNGNTALKLHFKTNGTLDFIEVLNREKWIKIPSLNTGALSEINDSLDHKSPLTFAIKKTLK
jgi:Ca-activated chloride channel family protein